jgi:hypothetical protein
VPGPGRSSAAGPFVVGADHSSTLEGTLSRMAGVRKGSESWFFHKRFPWTPKLRSARLRQKEKAPFYGAFVKPSDGLDPSTLLTMERLGQSVAAHGNGFPLSEAFAAHSHLPPVATGCNRWAP